MTAAEIREARREPRRYGRHAIYQSRVRARREELGLTREQVAFASGLSVSTVQRLETGFRAVPHYSSIEAVAKVLGLRAEDLI